MCWVAGTPAEEREGRFKVSEHFTSQPNENVKRSFFISFPLSLVAFPLHSRPPAHPLVLSFTDRLSSLLPKSLSRPLLLSVFVHPQPAAFLSRHNSGQFIATREFLFALGSD